MLHELCLGLSAFVSCSSSSSFSALLWSTSTCVAVPSSPIPKSYTQFSSDVEVDLRDFTITLSRNDKIYPKTEEKNPCKPDFENVLLDVRWD